jgi:hypothetical protein
MEGEERLTNDAAESLGARVCREVRVGTGGKRGSGEAGELQRG